MQFYADDYAKAGPLSNDGPPNDVRSRFVQAVRDCARAEDRSARCRNLEVLIDASRPVSHDDALLPEDVVKTLVSIHGRYRLLASTENHATPRSFREARKVLAGLFF